jgi:hypothetical protein
MDTSAIITAFLQGFGKWTGCTWATRFGAGGINLVGLKSSQARLMARSTAGAERADWTAATRWLEEVERDAKEAEEEACLAADLAILGQLESAAGHMQRACSLESKYGGERVWQPLCNTLAEQAGCGKRSVTAGGPN